MQNSKYNHGIISMLYLLLKVSASMLFLEVGFELYALIFRTFNELIRIDLLELWKKKECIVNDPTDHRLILLGSSRRVGTQLSFDVIKERTLVSLEVRQNFFSTFIV